MIRQFADSWPLFHTTYLTGALVAVTLSVVGVWVVARNQIFLGVAIAQASTLGVATALWLGGSGLAASMGWLGSEAAATGFAVGASVATALLTARRNQPGAESAEAVTGWVYLLAASAPVLMLANSPHGLEEIHQLVFSTILAVTPSDPWIFAALACVTLVVVIRLRRALLLFALDPDMAAAVGLRPAVWNWATAAWLGLAVGLSIRVSGTLFTFGCLVLPAMIAKNLSREVQPLLLLAPLVVMVAVVAGFVFAHGLDTPPAHTSVALLCAGLLAAWGVRRWRVGGGAA